MKSLIILILLIALGAAAFFTRPSEANFADWYRQQQPADEGGNILTKIFNPNSPDKYLKDSTYKNYLLFANIEHDGQTTYTGAFSHWFKRTPPAAPSPAK